MSIDTLCLLVFYGMATTLAGTLMGAYINQEYTSKRMILEHSIVMNEFMGKFLASQRDEDE